MIDKEAARVRFAERAMQTLLVHDLMNPEPARGDKEIAEDAVHLADAMVAELWPEEEVAQERYRVRSRNRDTGTESVSIDTFSSESDAQDAADRRRNACPDWDHWIEPAEPGGEDNQ